MRITADVATLPGTAAMTGGAGGHHIVVDRPEGRAGGRGLGFNGAQLLALALGGCFGNDLHYAAHALGMEVEDAAIRVTLTLGGEPLVATRATVRVRCRAAGGEGDATAIVTRAIADCTVANTLCRSFPVEFTGWDDGADD